jgi:hypothetical protein
LDLGLGFKFTLRFEGLYVFFLIKQQRACHTVTLLFTLKSILRQKKNYENSNISPYKNIIFQKSSKRNQNPSKYYNSIITNLKFQHSSQNIIFQKSSYKNRPITSGPKSLKLSCLDLWGAKGAGGPPLSVLHTFYRQRVLVALRCVQVISILRCVVTLDEDSSRLASFQEVLPFPYLICFL